MVIIPVPNDFVFLTCKIMYLGRVPQRDPLLGLYSNGSLRNPNSEPRFTPTMIDVSQ